MFPELPGEVQTITSPPLGLGVDSECKIREHRGGNCPVSVSWPLLPPPGVSFIEWTVDMPVMCSAGLHWAFPLHFFHSTDCIHKALSSEDSEDALLERSWDYLVIRRKPRGQCFLWRPWISLYSLLIRQWENIFIFHHRLPFLKKMFSVFSFFFSDY